MKWQISMLSVLQIGLLGVVHAFAAEGNSPAEEGSGQEKEAALIIGLSSSTEEVSSVVQNKAGEVGVTTVVTPSGTSTITTTRIGDTTVHNLSNPSGKTTTDNSATVGNQGMVHALATEGNRPDKEGSGQEKEAALIIGLSSSTEEVSSVVQNKVGEVDVATVVTPSGTATVTSTPVGDTTVHNLSNPSGESITGTSTRIGNTTILNTSNTDGERVSATTQSIGNVQVTTGSSGQGSFSAITQKVGNTNITIVTTPSGTRVGTSTQVGNTTVHNFTPPPGLKKKSNAKD